MQFRYRAVRADGQIQRGVLLAAHPADLSQRLARTGLTLLAWQAQSGWRAYGWAAQVSRRDVIHFCFYLEQLTRAGVPLLDGLRDLRDSVDNPRLRDVVATLVEDVQGGQQLSQALAAHPAVFSPLMVGLVAAGELAGTLADVLQRLTDTLKRQDELRAHTRRLLLYPMFLLALVGAVAGFMLAYLVPQLASFLQSVGESLPLSTRLLLGLSALLRSYGLPALLGGLALVMSWRLVLRRQPGLARLADRLKLRAPLFGPVWQKIILARFASEFGMLFAAGIPLLDSLRMSEQVLGNREIEAGVAAARQLIGEGHGISDSFALTDMFPPLVVRMLQIGETTGELERALDNVAYFYRRDVQESVDRLLALIEPTLTAALGLLLLWVISAVMAPVYGMLSQLGGR